MQFGAVTDIGMHRKINEDNYYVNESDTFPYAVVADGMGGHQAGEVASMMVVDIIENHLEKTRLCRGRRSYTSGVYIGEQYHIQLCKESL